MNTLDINEIKPEENDDFKSVNVLYLNRIRKLFGLTENSPDYSLLFLPKEIGQEKSFCYILSKNLCEIYVLKSRKNDFYLIKNSIKDLSLEKCVNLNIIDQGDGILNKNVYTSTGKLERDFKITITNYKKSIQKQKTGLALNNNGTLVAKNQTVELENFIKNLLNNKDPKYIGTEYMTVKSILENMTLNNEITKTPAVGGVAKRRESPKI